MWSYYELVTDFPERVIVRLKEEVRTGVLHPMEAKTQLAHNIIAGFHGEEAAKKAADEFRRVFRERQAPQEIPMHKVPAGAPKPIVKLLVELGAVASRSEAERLIKQGAVEFEGERLRDVTQMVALTKGAEWKFRVGKKTFLRVLVE
jgi:tyrosyl-tRNA synthetase